MMYRTKRGDVLDAICARYYGEQDHSVEAVYDANAGLADHGAVLPAGLLITLPEAEVTAQVAQPIKLWD